MSPQSLLRLYPRTWREHYGEEFLEACGHEPLTMQQVIDIVGGAIDARFAPQIHLAASGQSTGGTHMSATLKHACANRGANYTTQDGLKAAAFIVGGSFMLIYGSRLAKQNELPEVAQFLRSAAVTVPMLLSSLFTFMKGQSPIANLIIIGGPMLIILAMCAWTAVN